MRKRKQERKKIGRCSLTGQEGSYVKAHLIPEALTRAERKGAPLIQFGDGQRPSKRWTSWYDQELVTDAGEVILSRLDTLGIATLRRHKLLWSGWSSPDEVLRMSGPLDDWGRGGRKIDEVDCTKLRLFFLSLLWRTAATKMPGFKEIDVPDAEIEQLRRMIVGGDPEPYGVYPISLTQLSTTGVIHNDAPRRDRKKMPALEGLAPWYVDFYRFYFDGLIVHFNIGLPKADPELRESPLYVGAKSFFVVSTIPYCGSTQRLILDSAVDAAAEQWPQLRTLI